MTSKSKTSFIFFLVKWFLIIVLGISFFPITIGLLIIWLIIKKAGNKKLKIVLLIVIVTLMVLIGAGVVYAIQHPSPKSTINQNPTSSPENSPIRAIETNNPSATPDIGTVKVTRVIDGDTIEIDGGKRVRLIGMDTPELNKSGEVGCFGREAYDYTNKLLSGQNVRLEKDVSETDKYGRLLRFVYLGDIFINDKLVKDGYARVYTYPPDVKYQDQFRESEKYARENNLGLWSACNATLLRSTVAPVVNPTNTPKQNTHSLSGSYTCDCSKPCTVISSCAEAQYQLKTCGCTKRDGDGDGIACDGAPLNCQN